MCVCVCVCVCFFFFFLTDLFSSSQAVRDVSSTRPTCILQKPNDRAPLKLCHPIYTQDNNSNSNNNNRNNNNSNSNNNNDINNK